MRFFRTPGTGDAVFGISETLGVFHVDSMNGAVAAAAGAWPPEGIMTITVASDVAAWLLWIAAGSQ